MIANILQTVTSDINQFFKFKFNLKEDLVILSHLQNPDGSVPLLIENKMVCSLIGIEQDKTNVNFTPSSKVVKNPPVNLNLYVLFTTNFAARNYVEALRLMSGLIAFFQGKKVFTPQNTPALNQEISKITVEVANIELKELINMWGSVGAKHMPSIIYKIRMLSIDGDMLIGKITNITGLDNEIK